MFDSRARIADFEIGEGMRAASVAHEQGITLAVVPGSDGFWADLDESAITLFGMAGTDAFRDDRTLRISPDVNHLGTGVGLLSVIRHGDRVELTDGFLADQEA